MKTSGRAKCTHPGCGYVANFRYDSMREYREGASERERFKCVRHMNPEQVLAKDNARRAVVLTVVEETYGKFWNDGTKNGSGFAHGNGYQAHADDFPVGSKLTIVATLDLPEAHS